MEDSVAPCRFLIACLFLSSGIATATPLKGVVVLDDIKDPPTLDPLAEFSEKNHTLIQQMLEGLVRLSPDGHVEPALAESWEQPTPLCLRFHLRKGVVFHNGEPFDSESVRFSLEKYINPSTGYPGRGFFASIDRVEIVDTYTVDIITRYPDGVLLRRLAGLITLVPPIHYAKVGNAGFARHPVGTGPFRFDHWSTGQEIGMTANRDYWEKGLPKIDVLTFRFLPPSEQINALISGSVDLVMEMPGTMTLPVKRNSSTTVFKKETLYTVGATFNNSRWPLSDTRFRQALNYAVNRQELIRYDLLGNGQSAATLSLPGTIGHDPALIPYAYDPNKAKDLLKQVGVKTPYHLKTLIQAYCVRASKILAKQFESIGIILDVEIGTESDLLQKFRDDVWDMAVAGMPDPTAHSSFVQSILIYSHSPYSLFKSSDYDHRLEEFTSTLSHDDQVAKGRELDRFVYAQALSLFTYQRVQTYGLSRRIRFIPYLTAMPHFRSVEVLAEPDAGGK